MSRVMHSSALRWLFSSTPSSHLTKAARSHSHPTLTRPYSSLKTSEEVAYTHPERVHSRSDAILSPAITAFAERTGLRFDDPTVLIRALTHKSFQHGQTSTGERLEHLGTKVLNLYATEYIHTKYPNLPVKALIEATQEYIGDRALSQLGRVMGVNHVMQWKPASPDPVESGEDKVISHTVRALVGGLYHTRGAKKARAFIHTCILSKPINEDMCLKFSKPKMMLSALMKRHGRERPISRLQQESGRRSASPIYIVGVYSGTQELGRGSGPSIKRAEYNAAKSALRLHFLKELVKFQLPSDTEEENEDMTFFSTELGDSTPII